MQKPNTDAKYAIIPIVVVIRGTKKVIIGTVDINAGLVKWVTIGLKMLSGNRSEDKPNPKPILIIGNPAAGITKNIVVPIAENDNALADTVFPIMSLIVNFSIFSMIPPFSF